MRANSGSKVTLEFVGRLKDGTVFGEASGENPLRFTLGQGEMLPGIEEAVLGMEPGQEKTFQVPSEKAFGTYDQRKRFTVERDEFDPDEQIIVGMTVALVKPDGQRVSARVKSLDDQAVTLDSNHPLAGQDLDLHVRVMEVTPGS